MSAAAPTSEVAVCNLALMRLGQKVIASIDAPSTPEEDICAAFYPVTRQALLREYVFNFAKKYAQLTVSGTETPAHGFTTAFALPNDHLRLLAIGDVSIDGDVPHGLFDIVNGFIYTDYSSATNTLNIYYIRDVTDVNKWDALFKKLCYLELAKAMSFKFTLKPSFVLALDQELKDVRAAAAAIAGQEKRPRTLERSKYRAVRRQGLGSRDNTRYPV